MLKNFFSVQSQNSDLNQKGSILIKIIWSVLLIITLSFSINMFLQPENIYRYSLIIIIMWLVSLTSIFFAKTNHIYFITCFYIAFLLFMIFLFSWSGGGIKGHGIKILPIVVLLAGLTLGKKEIWFFGTIATLGGLGLVLANYFHQLPLNEPLGQSPLIFWIYNTTSIFLLCFLENLSVENLRKALDKSEKELRLRKKSEELLKIKNEKLIEIAFLQSHMVRRPVASVLGLISIINTDHPGDPINSEIIPKLKIAANELDTVIHDIVRNTLEVESITQNRSLPIHTD
jgi:hypothetical protein